MSAEQWAVAALATWRIAFMLVYELGPFAVFHEVRKRLLNPLDGEDEMWDVRTFWNMFKCVSCMSMWVAPAVLAATWFLPIWMPGAVALSAAAVWLERTTTLVRRS